MDADVILLSAGFGMRLKPLTDICPKPLLEVGGKTLLQLNLELLVRDGFKKAFVNVHHLGDKIKSYLQENDFGIEIEVVEEEGKILGTGGAVRNIEDKLVHENVLVMNSDVLWGSEFSPADLLNAHINSGEETVATLVLRQDPQAATYGLLGISENSRVVRFKGHDLVNEPVTQELMFTGASVVTKRLIKNMPSRGQEFCLANLVFKQALERHEYIYSVVYSGYWNDVGTKERLQQAEEDLLSTPSFFFR